MSWLGPRPGIAFSNYFNVVLVQNSREVHNKTGGKVDDSVNKHIYRLRNRKYAKIFSQKYFFKIILLCEFLLFVASCDYFCLYVCHGDLIRARDRGGIYRLPTIAAGSQAHLVN